MTKRKVKIVKEQEEKSTLMTLAERIGAGLAVADHKTPRIVKAGAMAVGAAALDVAIGGVATRVIKHATWSTIIHRTIKNIL